MHADRWERVKAIFAAAVEEPPARRDAFLDEACAGDASLRAEVQSLIDGHQADDFLEVPAAVLDERAHDDAWRADALLGRRLGPYEITARLGQGGMGIVYLARDTRLNRLVAVKALKPAFVSDPRRRARLAREARAAGALSHPGIATVYALEEFDDGVFIVGEYVRGETLREELARGPLPIDRLVDTAVRIAEALAAAHDQGVVHRDLKPENIIRAPEGGVKVLDFGLARMTAPGDEVPSAASQLTEAGGLAGTPAYMAPEQLRGDAVDFRADLFAFGALVYELATGRQPFGGADPISTITRVLNDEPERLSTRASVPAALDGIVNRCLRKRPDERYASTRDLLADLQRVQQELAVASAERGGALPTPYHFARDAHGSEPHALRWWQIHQVVAGVAPCLLLIALWQVQSWTPDALGDILFVASAAAAAALATLRLHLAFTSRFYPRELAAQRARGWPWILAGELLFIVMLLAGAGLIATGHRGFAALLAAAGIALALSSAIIEPATTRAAFGSEVFHG